MNILNRRMKLFWVRLKKLPIQVFSKTDPATYDSKSDGWTLSLLQLKAGVLLTHQTQSNQLPSEGKN